MHKEGCEMGVVVGVMSDNDMVVVIGIEMGVVMRRVALLISTKRNNT